MKVFVFDGSYMMEVIIARSPEEAWEFLTTHSGTSSNGGTLEDLQRQWTISSVFDPSTMQLPDCAGHYSG